MALTTQQQILQNQIDALDSSATTESLLKILNQSIAAGTIMWGYDSASVMPADSDYIGMIAFSNKDSDLYFHGTDLNWHLIDSAASVPPPTPANSVLQGENYGYSLGGYNGSANNVIQKFSLTSDVNATDVGDLSSPALGGTGGFSPTYGYRTHGRDGPATYVSNYDYFPFASDGNSTGTSPATNVNPGYYSHSEAVGNGDYVYTAGLLSPAIPGAINSIEKFATASIVASGTDVGDLTETARSHSGASSSTYGYHHGGYVTANSNVIDKWPFATDTNATDVGDLLISNYSSAGHQSSTYGYVSGGSSGTTEPLAVNTITKYSFSSDGNATDGGDLTFATILAGGNSSTVSGYVVGGGRVSGPVNYDNVIDKFPFASDANATDVGDLTYAHDRMGTTQY